MEVWIAAAVVVTLTLGIPTAADTADCPIVEKRALKSFDIALPSHLEVPPQLTTYVCQQITVIPAYYYLPPVLLPVARIITRCPYYYLPPYY